MKPKTIVTAALLLFVTASVVYLAVKETGGKPGRDSARPDTSAPQTGQEQDTRPASSSNDATADSKVVVYYFHGNVRCMTCRTIEAHTKEAINSGFSEALSNGRLEWRTVNVDSAGNEHFVQDFQLSTRSVVLELIEDGQRRRWKNLERVWELVRGDKADFLKYIQDQTTIYLESTDE